MFPVPQNKALIRLFTMMRIQILASKKGSNPWKSVKIVGIPYILAWHLLISNPAYQFWCGSRIFIWCGCGSGCGSRLPKWADPDPDADLDPQHWFALCQLFCPRTINAQLTSRSVCGRYSTMTLDRIRRDLQRVLVDPLPGVFILPNEEDISTIHVLISGPFETPYEGGFFHFVVRCPPNYPFK